MKIHTQIKKARTEANLSQQQLADKAGIKQAQVSMIESGKVNPSIGMLHSIATALDCEFSVGKLIEPFTGDKNYKEDEDRTRTDN